MALNWMLSSASSLAHTFLKLNSGDECNLIVTVKVLDALFFKFSIMSWVILGAISQSTYFAVSCSGSLDRVLNCIEISDESATYTRKVAVIYTTIAWVMFLVTNVLTFYAVFFTGDYMDIILAPITTHVNLPDLLVPRVVVFLLSVYFTAAWMFPHVMSFVLANIFTHQYIVLSKTLKKSDACPLSDSDKHQLCYHNVRSTDEILTAAGSRTIVDFRIRILKLSDSVTRRFPCQSVMQMIS